MSITYIVDNMSITNIAASQQVKIAASRREA